MNWVMTRRATTGRDSETKFEREFGRRRMSNRTGLRGAACLGQALLVETLK
jgi:hypothetical protein